jgi:hypothetical protein
MVSKGKRSLNFVMRNLKGASTKVRGKAYTVMVRPLLEYASSAWDPDTQTLKDVIEKVQRKAARRVLNKYGPRHSPTEMTKALGWATLERRRALAKISNLHKSMIGYAGWREIGQRLIKATRPGRKDHCYKLQKTGYNTNTGKSSFISTAVRQWNDLPEQVLSPWPDTAKILKARLKELEPCID